MTPSDGVSTDTKTVTITVLDPNSASQFSGTKTVCLSNNTDFAGCPTGAKQVASSTDLSRLPAEVAAGGRRILFHRGHTWTVAGTQTVYVTTANDPGLIGSFGTGSAPVWQAAAAFPTSSQQVMVQLSSVYGKLMADWRVMDITVDGSLVPAPKNLWGISLYGGLDQFTLLRVTANAVTIPFAASWSLLNAWNSSTNTLVRGHHIWDQLAVVDLRQTNAPHGTSTNTGTYPYGLYIAGERMAIMGGDFDNLGDNVTGVSHNIRIPYAAKFVVAHNNIANPGPTEHNLKIHGPIWTANPLFPGDPTQYVEPTGVTGSGSIVDGVAESLGKGYTRWGYVADNKIVGGYTPWLIAVGPESDNTQARVKDIVFDSNWAKFGVAGQRVLNAWGTYITIRNNLFDLSAGKTGTNIGVWTGRRNARYTAELYADRVASYNNTIYSGSAVSGFQAMYVEPLSTNVSAKNLLAYAPLASSPVTLSGQAPDSVGGNTTAPTTNPLFTGALSAVTGWQLQVGSPYLGTGVSAPVWSDFFKSTWLAGTAVTKGASQK